ncbi:uncharacterized protein LOC135488150 [Lineus longissimus]|uniref:uncharacterized protein LOC135488150 n=1 Tax=Lineus longissimus TaxID=88925 RepID=UPI002B4CF3F1
MMNVAVIGLVLMFAGPIIGLDTTNCGGLFYINSQDDTGEIKSPNYPNNYGIMDKCIWKFVACNNYSVALTIPSFAGQEGFNGSCRDYLEIRDGSSKEALLAVVCNSSTNMVVQSRSKWLWVKFYSDYEGVNTGFRATWKLVYHGYNSQQNPINFARCMTPMISCPNGECVPISYRCDGVNDCGYSGTGSDEDYWCDYKLMEQPVIYAWGFGSGAIACVLVFLLALCMEGYCSCCCPKGTIEKLACYKCMNRLSGKGANHERKNWPTYMRNPAILKLTGDVEGYKEYEKFDKERDQKKYEKIKKLKEEEEQRVRKVSMMSSMVSLQAISPSPTPKGKGKAKAVSTAVAKDNKPENKTVKKGEVNLAFENENTSDPKSVKKLTRQKAFNYEEQPQLEDLEFREGLTPLPSPSPSERSSAPDLEPTKEAKKADDAKNTEVAKKTPDSKGVTKGRVKGVAKKK